MRTWEISNAQNGFWEDEFQFGSPHHGLIPNFDASLIHVLQRRVDHLEHWTRWDVARHSLAILT